MSTPSAYLASDEEAGIIGACLMGGRDACCDAISQVPLEAVVSDEARETLALIASMVDAGDPVDVVTLGRAWQKRHKAAAPVVYWSKAMELCPTDSLLPGFIAAVNGAWQRRKLRLAAQRLADESGDRTKPLDAVLANLEAGIAIQADCQPQATSAMAVGKRFVDWVQARHEARGKIWGIPTGFPRLDEMMDGLQPGEVCIVGARPSVGKTAFALNVAAAACLDHQVPTLVVTAEMSEDALHRRLVGSLSGVSLHEIRRGNLNQREFEAITVANSRIARSNLRFLDVSAGGSVSTVTAGIRREVRKSGIKLVVVDYLQKIKPSEKNEKRTYEVADVSERLKACAKSTGVALLCLAQVSRESEKDKGRLPRLSDLSDSSQIEKDADTVLLLHRDRSVREGEASLIIAKQRDGECGLLKMFYKGQFCRFTEMEREKPE